MKHKIRISLILSLIIVTNLLFSQNKATTADGKIVLLNEDGTWSFEKNSNKQIESVEKIFRNSAWGDSKDKVKASEEAKFIAEDKYDNGIEFMGYNTNVGSLDALVGYYFVENKLYTSKYLFQEKHSNRNDFISDFNKINQILTDKYGEPNENEKIWRNDLYKNQPEDYGMAIAVGHLIYYSKWKLNKTTITLSLSGSNYKIKHIVEYLSDDLILLARKAKDKTDKSVF